MNYKTFLGAILITFILMFVQELNEETNINKDNNLLSQISQVTK